MSSVLTSSNNTVSYEAGYYENFTVSTNITNVPGIITYTYHHHSLTDPNYTTSSASGGSYLDSYQSTTRGGCFTTPYYHVQGTITSTCGSGLVWEYDASENRSRLKCHREGCSNYNHTQQYEVGGWQKDGRVEGTCTGTVTTYVDKWTTSASSNVVATKYIRSCGKSEGQIASATITY